MNIRILQIGKTKEDWLKTAVEEYLKRLRPYVKMEILDVPDTPLTKTNNIDIVRQKEAETILNILTPDDHLVLLDERGEEKTSLEFAQLLTKLSVVKRVVFLIGGVYGTDIRLKHRANSLISLSRLTFTHQFVRLILAEQIYRAVMINHNKPYHY
ncbi:MAG: hypothetical protein CVU48_08065 [Candidatus Cloacimonetes bacterium HGW-Cloacimonetes-1]|jgi:23S rRNA (pseudouridine1915-N3)-methyltransferase|nr:MAG: hypothetical protein CVU48_08065 [Candidatus Cloacimonetes bacterium HGW-Cloacimonetes-1]